MDRCFILLLGLTCLLPKGTFAEETVIKAHKAVPVSKRVKKADPKPWMKPDPKALKRWEDMRFGMFIHWGPVSLTGHEIGWSRGAETPIAEYDQLYKRFNPVKFDADKWVSIAKAAGMKYIVLTTKHHDGFCMFNTKATDYNIMNSPFGRDVTRELSLACKRQGIAFGTYYSVCDWHNPDFPLTSPGGSVKRETSNIEAYTKYLETETKELIRNYGPLVLMWFDVPQEVDQERGERIIRHVRSLQPSLIVNNRSGAGGDYDTPEQTIGMYQDNRPWETCMTICNQWSWKPDDTMKPLDQCLRTLITCAGGDGNLLFNVGPTPDGIIEERQAARLQEMGEWLKHYGESVYGTRGGPWMPTPDYVSTRKGDTVYLHIFKWSSDTLALPALPKEITRAMLLTGGNVTINRTSDEITLYVPIANRQPIDTVIKLTLKSSAMDIPVIHMETVGGVVRQLTPYKFATASNTYQLLKDHAPDKALDGNPGTRWATDAGTHTAWLEVDYGKQRTFDAVVIMEKSYPRTRLFELLWLDGETWKPFYKGTTIGERLVLKLDPITTQKVRLNILDATEGPTIEEFQMLEIIKK